MKRLAVFLIFLLCLSVSGLSAQDVSAQRSKKKKLESEIKMLEKQLRENGDARKNKMANLNLVKRKVDARSELVSESKRELARLNDSIYLKRRQVNIVQARLDTMTLYFNKLVKNAYKNRDARIWYMYILASNSFSQATRRYGYLRSLSVQMNAQARRIKETKAQLQQRLEELGVLRAKANEVKKAHEAELAVLQGEKNQLSSMIKQLEKDKGRYTREIASKKKQVEALNREIERIIAAAMKESESSKKPGAKIDYVLAGEFEANRGKLPWPAEGPVVGSFGQHPHPVYKSIMMPFNNGINIGLSRGTKVKCVFNGVVKKIIVLPGYNKCVLVQHGNYFTFYCKLASVNVKAGQKISTGQEIGAVDTIDGETQLHFELWKGTSRQNPTAWLRP